MPPPIYIFEDSQFDLLAPLTYLRPAFQLRCGAFTLLERIQQVIRQPAAAVLVRRHLAATLRAQISIPVNPAVSTKDGVLLINGRWLAAGNSADFLSDSTPDSAGLLMGSVAWMHLSAETAAKVDFSRVDEPKTLESLLPDLRRVTAKTNLIARPWDLIAAQDKTLRGDFDLFGAASIGTVHPGAHLLSPENIHVALNAKIWPGVVLDAQGGPIIIEEGAEIRANAVITGPAHIGKNCVVRTAADVRELTSLGPNSRVGGEVMHSIFLGNSNKQHHGFVGQSIVGSWANLGAGTTTSNLKNTYGTIRVPIGGVEEESGQQFFGAIIGDHAKLGIGTYLSTGSVIGLASHILAPRPAKFIPSFAWLNEFEITRADFEKIVAIAKTVMTRRGVEFTQADHDLLVHAATEDAPRERFDWADGGALK
jgi:UDP-N-acetylglucosamine diphosphorylase/glucosamine-1-phosphate N-acetyltransferase